MKRQFLGFLEDHFSKNLIAVSPLQEVIRSRAWKRFCEIGLPEKTFPGFQYFPFSQLYKSSYIKSESTPIPEPYSPLIYPESTRSFFLFVNGQYMPHLSNRSALPKEVVAIPLSEALDRYGHFLQARVSRALKEDLDPFAVLNIALIQKGLFLYIPPGVECKPPIQCLHLIEGDQSLLLNPRIHIVLGKGAKGVWASDHTCLKGDCSEGGYCFNSVIDITLEEGANLDHYGLFSHCSKSFSFEAIRASLKSRSLLRSFTATGGAASVRQDYHISLLGEAASSELKGIALLSETRQSHTHVLIEHHAPSTHSNQHFKHVVSDRAKASFEGKIFIASKAQKSQAYQLNNNLLLGEKAMANSKPNLEIYADDVKASHGATVTELDADQLFYFRSRGLGLRAAKGLLLSGFWSEMVKEIPLVRMRGRITQIAEKALR